MMAQSWRDTWPITFWGPFFLALTAAAIPLSPTAKSILLSIATALILFVPAYRKDLCHALSQSWCRSALLLLGVVIVACVWSPATADEKSLVVDKFSKLLYLPILVVGFRNAKTRQWGLYAFLLAMVITALISIVNFHLLTGNKILADNVFHNHIMTSFMMALAAYHCGMSFFRQEGTPRLVYGVLWLVFSYQLLFVNAGRMGYALYFGLTIFLLLQVLRPRRALAAMCIVCVAVTLAYFTSPMMQSRIKEIQVNWQQYQHNNKDTSVGDRLVFHLYAKELFLRHPLAGNGTGSYRHCFREDDPLPRWHDTILEPHSMYWLVAAEYGVLGLLVLGYFFGSLLLTSLRLPTLKYLALGLLVAFAVGNLTDSLLFYSGTGFFFLLMMGLCLGEGVKSWR